jgi:hypothetical protein
MWRIIRVGAGVVLLVVIAAAMGFGVLLGILYLLSV